ncbi:hypothetical protein LTR66_003760 [Elasticomyces elasticus]|nr:hypothetical protein LTR50_001800 [Elasticomyces elasticus]KAK4996674.1 hypothetical protein LTR66_003760 [Elasticomyces elasticus]
MAGTRSSARVAAKPGSSPPADDKNASTKKRKADNNSSPTSTKSKRGRKSNSKEQKTLEETMPSVHDEAEDDQPKDIEMKEAGSAGEGAHAEPKQEIGEGTAPAGEHAREPGCWFWPDNAEYAQASGANGHAKVRQEMLQGKEFEGKTKEGEDASDPEKSLKDSRDGHGLNSSYYTDKVKAANKQTHKDETHDDETNGTSAASSAVTEDKQRAEKMPSTILEKGIIYFFTRGRVGIDEPESVQDLQRSYFVLRPLPLGAAIGDGAIEELKNARLCALPKKVFPKSHQDRFMVFVDKAKTTMQELKETFFQGSEYDTKTTGTRHTPPVSPVGEGVYAITTTGRESHLVYILTIPSEIGEVQEEMGIRSKGSFVISLKNPTAPGPAYASLPQGPDYPQEIMEEFRGLRWMGVQPKHLDYDNAQMLLIGEGQDDLGKAVEPSSKDQKHHKETPEDEMNLLEDEDKRRVEHLHGDDTVFDDLGISSKDYPKVLTTW